MRRIRRATPDRVVRNRRRVNCDLHGNEHEVHFINIRNDKTACGWSPPNTRDFDLDPQRTIESLARTALGNYCKEHDHKRCKIGLCRKRGCYDG